MYRLKLYLSGLSVALSSMICSAQTQSTNTQGNPQLQDDYRIVAIENGKSTQSVSNIDQVEVAPSIYVPNAFSPDDDGINDRFSARVKGVSEYQITIFDRWGEVVFSSNDPSDSWNGMKDGVPVPTGGYVYSLIYKTPAIESTKSIEGTIALVR